MTLVALTSEHAFAPWVEDVMASLAAFAHRLTEEAAPHMRDRTWRELARNLFLALPEPALLVNAITGQVLDANPAVCTLYGYTRRELLELHLADLSGSSSLPGHPRRRLHRRADGQAFWVEVTSTPFLEHPEPLALFLVRNATLEAQTEGALRESEARYRGLFESAPVAIWEEDYGELKAYLEMIDVPSGASLEGFLDANPNHLKACLDRITVRNVNLKALELYGVKTHPALFSHLACLSEADTRTVLAHQLAAFRSGQLSFETEVRTSETVHGAKDIVLVARLAPGAEADWSQLLVSFVDITDRNRALEGLRRIAEENAALLMRSRHEAQEKSVLLQEVNHRVKNNLTSILGMVDMELQASLRSGHRSSQAFADLKQRIFALASVHELLSAAEWSPLRLENLATDLVQNTLWGSPVSHRVRVDVSPSRESIWVTPRAATALAMILAELTTNSVKYAFEDRDSGRIQLKIRSTKDAWNRVTLTFQDDGPGYPQEVLEEQKENVGLKLIRLHAKNLQRGELVLDNQRGARVRLTFQPMPMAARRVP